MNNWTDIKEQRPPDNKVVLVYVTNTDGGSGVCLASFAAKHTLEADDEAFGDLIDYCEEEDTCYAPEGWYGNAIVAPVASLFIKAFMEVIDEQPV